MLIRIYNDNPNEKHIRQVVDMLEGGGIIIYPTDTVYAMGCDIRATRAIDKIARFKGLNPKNPDMSLIFKDMSQLSEYTVITILYSSCLSEICQDRLHLLSGQITRYRNYSRTGRRR